MSRVKSPPEKKRLRLARDRRNVYGESPHGARKSIPRNKAHHRQAERRAADQALAQAMGRSDLGVLEGIENHARARARLRHVSGFRKVADGPLGEVLAWKRARRVVQAGRKKRARARLFPGIITCTAQPEE